MLSLFFALVAVGLVSGAPPPPPPAPIRGCPNGGLGLGESLICPPGVTPVDGGCNHEGGLTATIYAPGSCTPIAHGTPLENAGFCTDASRYNQAYTGNVAVGCELFPGDDLEVTNITVPSLHRTFTKCVYLADPQVVNCSSSATPSSYIYECCT